MRTKYVTGISHASCRAPHVLRKCFAFRVTDPRLASSFETHTVENQPPPLDGLNLFETNVPLVEALEREGAGWARERARAAGAVWGG
jgi:Adaptive response protein AidB N-terminal domain